MDWNKRILRRLFDEKDKYPLMRLTLGSQVAKFHTWMIMKLMNRRAEHEYDYEYEVAITQSSNPYRCSPIIASANFAESCLTTSVWLMKLPEMGL